MVVVVCVSAPEPK
jgi:hypothetical protein